jgi:hypothetical protein
MPEARWGRRPNAAALLGALCVLPFVAANTIVSNRIEPFFSLIRPGEHTSAFEYALLVVVIGCIAAGAYIAGRPVFDSGASPRIYATNGALAAFLLVVFVVLSSVLGSEIYRCDVLGIPNCD